MEPRLKNPLGLLPEAMPALHKIHAAVDSSGIAPNLAELMRLRASQINSCGACVYGHVKLLKRGGETDERINTVAVWRESPFFTDAERAALDLTESVTRLSDRNDPVPDEVWNEAARHFSEKELAALLFIIAVINVHNRINAATRQVAGSWEP